jgi:hypothetical protein
MRVKITLASDTGVDTGPFNLYSNTDGYVNAFAASVSRNALLSGYLATDVPVNTTTVKVQSTGNCTTSINLTVTPLPPPPPPPTENYLIVECGEDQVLWNAAKTHTFQIGDVVQFTVKINNDTIRCGTITADDYIAVADVSLYSSVARNCGNLTYCNIPNPLDD